MDAFSSVLESPARSLFRRCVQCPPKSPDCPACPDNQVCSFNSQTCDACASTTCVPSSEYNGAVSTPTPTPAPSSSPGEIAGIVIAVVVVIAVATILVWRFCIRNRRRAALEEPWNYNMGSEKDENEAIRFRDNATRASTHTRNSTASSVFTRASNIIPIAYIPGVTNRSVHSSQDLVPPVPPIPAASSTSPRGDGEEHFFRPDIRDSAYSNLTDRNSMARASIASTVYRNNAIVSPVPAQMISRAKPTAVSVRSSNKNSPTVSRSTTPPMPNMPAGVKTLNTKSSIVGRVGQPKPVQILRKQPSNGQPRTKHIYELDGSMSGNPSRQNSVTSPTDYGLSSPNTDDGTSDSEDRAAGQRLIRGDDASNVSTPAELSAYSRDSGDANLWDKMKHKKSTSLNQIIEEAAMQASRAPTHMAGYKPAKKSDASPFSDENEAHTP